MKSCSWDAFLCASMALSICNLLWGIFVYKAHMLVSNDGSVYGLWLPSTKYLFISLNSKQEMNKFIENVWGENFQPRLIPLPNRVISPNVGQFC
jgi:hypothetical protein